MNHPNHFRNNLQILKEEKQDSVLIFRLLNKDFVFSPQP